MTNAKHFLQRDGEWGFNRDLKTLAKMLNLYRFERPMAEQLFCSYVNYYALEWTLPTLAPFAHSYTSVSDTCTLIPIMCDLTKVVLIASDCKSYSFGCHGSDQCPYSYQFTYSSTHATILLNSPSKFSPVYSSPLHKCSSLSVLHVKQ